jgi:hypothetical protein
MQVLWWFVSTVLVVLSFVLLVAGLRGKEGTLRIGKVGAIEVDEASDAQPRPVHASNVALAIGGILVFIFTIVMDVLLVREWIQKRRDKQKPPENSDT